MATSGEVPRGQSVDGRQGRDIVSDLRALRASFETLDTIAARRDMKRDVEQKMKVMRTSVEKVEAAVCGMIIRGRERPKGWVPDTGGEERRETVESY